jgi:putative transposase
VAKCHLKVRNRRKDFIEKESGRTASAFDAVIAEDIDMHGMARALRFGRSVADNGWGMFVNMLRRRLEERGQEVRPGGQVLSFRQDLFGLRCRETCPGPG